jgi:hypothetical protein
MVFGMLERRELHLSAVCLLRDHLTQDNHRALLNEAVGKTKLQVQESIARHFPKPATRDGIRKLPRHAPPRTAMIADSTSSTPPAPTLGGQDADRHAIGVSGAASAPTASAPTASAPTASAPTASAPTASAPTASAPTVLTVSAPITPTLREPRRAVIEPVGEALYKVQFEASRRVKEKLDLARALSSHANPTGRLEIILEQALDLWLDKVRRQRFGKTDRSRKLRSTKRVPLQRLARPGAPRCPFRNYAVLRKARTRCIRTAAACSSCSAK